MIWSAALGLALLFSVLAFATTERWSLSIFQIAIFALGACRAFDRRPFRFPTAALPFVAAAAWGALQLLLGGTIYGFDTGKAALDWSAYLVLFLLAFESGRPLVRPILYGGSAIALLSLVQYFTSPGLIYWRFPAVSGRPFGPFGNPDHYAAFAEILLPMAICEAVRDRRRAWFHTALAALLYASVIAGGSRAGALLVTAEILLIPLLMGAVRLRTTAVLVVFGAAATLVVGYEFVWKRFQQPDPFFYRREMAFSSLQMIRERPWTGFGLGTYQATYPAYALMDIGLAVDHAHNDWLEWTAEGGLPFLAILLALVALSLRRARGAPWSWGVYAVFTHGLVDFPMHIPAIAALVFVILAALASRD